MKVLQTVVFIFFLIFVLSAGTCDHTVLHGTIVTERTKIMAGETIELKLEVPEDLEGIHRVIWVVKPKEFGTLKYKEGEDRKVLFTAIKAGSCIISTFGFYKQTNPQPITEIMIEISDSYSPETFKIPLDFQLEYVTGPTHAEWDSHHFIKIRYSPGKDHLLELTTGFWNRSISTQDGKMKKQETILAVKQLTQAECLSLYNTISENHFFELEKTYVDPQILDGSYRHLEIKANGKFKKVAVVNRSQKQFDRIVTSLEQLAKGLSKK